MGGQRAGRPGVVGVAEGEQVDARVERVEPRGPGQRRATGCIAPDELHPRREVVRVEGDGIWRPVVDDHHGVRLGRQDAVERFRQVGGPAMHGDERADGHREPA